MAATYGDPSGHLAVNLAVIPAQAKLGISDLLAAGWVILAEVYCIALAIIGSITLEFAHWLCDSKSGYFSGFSRYTVIKGHKKVNCWRFWSCTLYTPLSNVPLLVPVKLDRNAGTGRTKWQVG